MANGWEKLGQALAGTSDARRAEIQSDTIASLAARDLKVQQAKQALLKTQGLEGLGQAFTDIGLPEAYAVPARAGVNLGQYTKAALDQQKHRFHEGAAEYAGAGDWASSNAQLMGLANAPVALPDVKGNMLLSNRLVPGGGEVTVTPVGAAQIAADQARGQAALIRASRPAASGGGRRAASAPQQSAAPQRIINPKTGEIRELRNGQWVPVK